MVLRDCVSLKRISGAPDNKSEALEKLIVANQFRSHVTRLLRGRKHVAEERVVGHDLVNIRKSGNEVKLVYQSVAVGSATISDSPFTLRNCSLYGQAGKRLNLHLVDVLHFQFTAHI